MKFIPMKSFLNLFTLRQGTILIAILQLILSGYMFIFLVLGLTHATGIQEMIVRDTEDALEREALEEITSKHISSHRMELAHHNASEALYIMYCDLVVIGAHFLSSLLLLYGVLKNNRCCMTPWMMIMITIIVALIMSLFLVQDDCPFIAEIGGKANLLDRILTLIVTCICIYMWLLVYSNYRGLEIKKGLIHEVSNVKRPRQTSSHLKKTAKPKNLLPQPYNV